MESTSVFLKHYGLKKEFLCKVRTENARSQLRAITFSNHMIDPESTLIHTPAQTERGIRPVRAGKKRGMSMKQFLLIAFCAASLTAVAPVVDAAQIKRACLASDRQAATRQRCRCIQGVANDTLTNGDQKTVAKWFSDPHQAQVLKMSKSARDDALWDRYQAFGQLAQALCR